MGSIPVEATGKQKNPHGDKLRGFFVSPILLKYFYFAHFYTFYSIKFHPFFNKSYE